jgi:ribonuclease Z
MGEIRLIGYSVAGEESVVAAPELDVCFDVGKAPTEILAINHVLLTHGHMDHSAGLAYYFSQRNFIGIEPGCALLPAALVGPVRDLMKVWARIEGHESPARLVGMAPGDEHQIRRGLIARAFELNHRVPTLGFTVIDVRHKLRSEFADKTGPELVALKKQGTEIEYKLEVPLIAYCGDTAEGAWLENEIVRKARVIVLECTFFDPDHVRRARAGYHLHVRDVARILGRLENEFIVLTHLTRRTGLREARRILARLIDETTLSRVRFLMDGRRPRHGHAAGSDASGQREAAEPRRAAPGASVADGGQEGV